MDDDYAKISDYVEDYKKNRYQFPREILVELISSCNLSCIMCPQKNLTRSSGQMNYDLWKKIVDEVAQKSTQTRIWPAFMGESLILGDKIFPWFRYAADRGVNIHLNTNLVLLKKENVRGLLESGVKQIFIGIDASNEETYQKIRVNGSWKVLMERIEWILSEKERLCLDLPEVVLQFISMDENKDEKNEFIDFWKKQNKNIGLKIMNRVGWGDGVQASTEMHRYSELQRLPCTWLLRNLVVFWNGDVPQCDNDWNGKVIAGNVQHASIESIWNGELKKKRDQHIKGDFLNELCLKCVDWQAGSATRIKLVKSDL